jgi:lipopolysaccharide export system protein LptC
VRPHLRREGVGVIGRIGALGLLAALAGLSIWLTQESIDEPTSNPLVRGTDGYFEGVEISGTDEQGRLAYRLAAERAEHNPERDAIELTTVDVILLEEGTPVWLVVADSGLAPSAGNEIELIGDVQMRRAGGTSEFQISGESFTLFPDTESASSEGAVEVRMGDQTLTGVGFEADFNLGNMRLKSQVHARYSDAS